jgi:hypothetical protein
MIKWNRTSVLLAEGGRVRIHVAQSILGPLPDGVHTSSSIIDGLPTTRLEQAGAVVETCFDQETGTIKQTQSGGPPPELLLRGRHALLRLTSLLVQTADGATEEGTEVLLHRLAFGHPALPLDQTIRSLSPQIGRIVRPTGIAALFLANDAASDDDISPVLAYVTEGRVPLPFGGYLEAARIGAITGQQFRWEAKYAGRIDRFPDATTVWTRRS